MEVAQDEDQCFVFEQFPKVDYNYYVKPSSNSFLRETGYKFVISGKWEQITYLWNCMFLRFQGIK